MPTPTTVGMYNALLSAPFEFVLTQSFAFLTKAAGQGLLQRQYNQMSNAGDFAVSQAEELKDALDALTSQRVCHGRSSFHAAGARGASSRSRSTDEHRLKALNDDVALARAMLADTGMTTAREDLALEAAFWAQLPGDFRLSAAQSADHLAQLLPPRRAFITSPAAARPEITGAMRSRSSSRARARRITSRSTRAIRTIPTAAAARTPGTPSFAGRPDPARPCLIGFLVAMLARQGATQVIFDKDRGLEILVRALGGHVSAAQRTACRRALIRCSCRPRPPTSNS